MDIIYKYCTTTEIPYKGGNFVLKFVHTSDFVMKQKLPVVTYDFSSILVLLLSSAAFSSPSQQLMQADPQRLF